MGEKSKLFEEMMNGFLRTNDGRLLDMMNLLDLPPNRFGEKELDKEDEEDEEDDDEDYGNKVDTIIDANRGIYVRDSFTEDLGGTDVYFGDEFGDEFGEEEKTDDDIVEFDVK